MLRALHKAFSISVHCLGELINFCTWPWQVKGCGIDKTHTSTQTHTLTHTHNFHLKYYQTSVDDFIVRHKTLSQISPSGFGFKFPIQRVAGGDNDKQRRLPDALRGAPVLINKSAGQQRNHRQRGVIKMRITSIDILIMPFINAYEVHNLVEGPDYVTRFSTWSEKLRSRQWDTLTHTCTRTRGAYAILSIRLQDTRSVLSSPPSSTLAYPACSRLLFKQNN